MIVIAYGTPAPQGSKRHVGGGRMVEMSKNLKPWREAVKYAALQVRQGATPIDGPVLIRVVFTIKKAASAPKNRRTWPISRPDLDKLLRSTLDALKDAGIFTDDSRVVDCSRLAKVFPGEDTEALDSPGVRIMIEAIK